MDQEITFEPLGRHVPLRRQLVREYAAFLRTLFFAGDWFVTLTFRDRGQDLQLRSVASPENAPKARHGTRQLGGSTAENVTKYPPDPRLADWEPDSKYRREPGPPVRDAALREIEHFLLELGWEAAGHTRQEIFNRLAEDYDPAERRWLAKKLCRRCLICAVLNEPVAHSFFYEIRKVATRSIGWVIAEEFGRIGGRWHTHLLVHGAQHLGRKRWWRRAFLRFGFSRIEALHE